MISYSFWIQVFYFHFVSVWATYFKRTVQHIEGPFHTVLCDFFSICILFLCLVLYSLVKLLIPRYWGFFLKKISTWDIYSAGSGSMPSCWNNYNSLQLALMGILVINLRDFFFVIWKLGTTNNLGHIISKPYIKHEWKWVKYKVFKTFSSTLSFRTRNVKKYFDKRLHKLSICAVHFWLLSIITPKTFM